MSRAFVKEDDEAGGISLLPDRAISPHPNLVTRRGLAQIERRLAEHRREHAQATASGDHAAAARAARELRYWAARHASAEVVEPPEAAATAVVFGAAVTVAREDGTRATFRIVGEDEAEPTEGRIAWTAPVAGILLGSQVGDLRRLPSGEVEVLAIDAEPQPSEEG